MAAEHLHYDAESRVIYDENRLAVARDVAPDLGAVLAMAPAYRQTLDEIRKHAVNPSRRAGDILSQESEAVEGEPAAGVIDPPLWAILDDMLAYEAEQFDGDGDSPLDISGSDLVDAFTTWRGQLRAALAVRSASLKALERIAARLRGEWYNPAADLGSDIARAMRESGFHV